MAYSREVYEEAWETLAARRVRAQGDAQALRARMRRDPRVCELEQRMAGSVRKLTTAIQNGGYEETLARVREDNLAAQRELAAILQAAGETAGDFEPRYTCTLCEDTGYVRGQPCSCLTKLLGEIASRRLCALTGMRPQSFDTLDLSFYDDQPNDQLGCSPREHMQSVIGYARWYGEQFDTTHPSLLLRGATGTGKTHVSLAIAAAACARGASVIYGPVQTLLHTLEKEHFGREEGDTENTLIHCDLLILDDLGTEFSSPFYTGALYTIINGRMLAGRPTVISTNLSGPAIGEHYGEQIASRLIGTYESLLFVGRDIRQQKQQRGF